MNTLPEIPAARIARGGGWQGSYVGAARNDPVCVARNQLFAVCLVSVFVLALTVAFINWERGR